MIYTISRYGKIHIIDYYYNRSVRYYSLCGVAVLKSQRPNTLNFSDSIPMTCPGCLNIYHERYGKNPHGRVLISNVGERLGQVMRAQEKYFTFVRPEDKYIDNIARTNATLKGRYRRNFKGRKSDVY